LHRHPKTKAASVTAPSDARTLAFQKIQTVDYIAHMAAEMAAMSSAIGFPLLAHLLHLVRAQAELEAQTARDE